MLGAGHVGVYMFGGIEGYCQDFHSTVKAAERGKVDVSGIVNERPLFASESLTSHCPVFDHAAVIDGKILTLADSQVS